MKQEQRLLQLKKGAPVPRYDKDSIKILGAVEHIRLRPGMYIGGLDADGIHHLLREVVDNGMDEMVSGNATRLSVRIEGKTNTAIITDNGRGIPFGKHEKTGNDTLVEIFSTVFSGGKFNEESYQLSAGQNGVGLCAVNALSSSLEVMSCRGKKRKYLKFERGLIKDENLLLADSPSYTSVTFTPDKEIFGDASFDVERIEASLFQLSCLLPGKTFELAYSPADGSETTKKVFEEVEYLTGLFTAKQKPDEMPLFTHRTNSEAISSIIWFSQSSQFSSESFMNLIPTTDDGSHVDGVMKALINSFKKLTGKTLTKSQIQYGLGLIVAGKYSAPVFKGQSKSKVADNRIEQAVYQEVYPGLYEALKAAPDFVKYLVAVIEAQSKVVDEFELKSSVSAIKDKVKGNKLPAKLMAVPNCSVDDRELIICEGDSAGGGVTTARNPRFQEVLAIKGKILNPFKATKAQLLKSKEVSDIFVSVGGTEDTGTPLRCKRVFILTDADSDGCFLGDQKIAMLSGEDREIRDLVGEEGFWVYSSGEDGALHAGYGHSARITKYVDSYLKITLDNGEVVNGTANHPFMLRSGEYVKASELKAGDSLMPLRRKVRDRNSLRPMSFDNKQGKYLTDHRWVAEDFFEEVGGCHIHHHNEKITDNSPWNLRVFNNTSEHTSYHNHTTHRREGQSKRIKELHEGGHYVGSSHFIGYNKSESHSHVVAERNKKMWQDSEYREKMTKLLKERDVTQSKESTTEQWKNKEVAFRMKCSGAVNTVRAIMERGEALTKEAYEKSRVKVVWKWSTFLQRIDAHTVKEVEEFCENYNHRVLFIETVYAPGTPVYDITVEKYHNFALSAGVFVHNSHITSLVASLFTVLFPSFIQNHELCIMKTPLFTAVHGDKRAYGKDVTSAKQEFRKLHGKAVTPEIHRNKGLGEMSPAELVPVLKPGSRDVDKLDWSDKSYIEMNRLMGNNMDTRREILKEQAKC